jgi:L-Ala-D/L-Glu epimerase
MAPHPQRLTVTRRGWALARPFTTTRGVETTANVVIAEISDGDGHGRGECVPMTRYGESIDSVAAALDAMKSAVFSGLERETLQRVLPPGAARNALDCAFWDIDAKRAYCSVAELAGLGGVAPVVTAFTLTLDTPEKMAELATSHRAQPLLKLQWAVTAMSNECGRCGMRRLRRALSSMPTKAGMSPSSANSCRRWPIAGSN